MRALRIEFAQIAAMVPIRVLAAQGALEPAPPPRPDSVTVAAGSHYRAGSLHRCDASIYGTAEIRVPVAEFTLLVPLNAGVLATGDMGRVYVKGSSPGGLHNAVGTGFWVGFHELTADIRVMRANDIGRAAVITARIALPGGTSQ